MNVPRRASAAPPPTGLGRMAAASGCIADSSGEFQPINNPTFTNGSGRDGRFPRALNIPHRRFLGVSSIAYDEEVSQTLLDVNADKKMDTLFLKISVVFHICHTSPEKSPD